VALALLMGGWMMATQPFAAPDEASHYLRALSIANGHLVGRKVAYRPVPAGLTATELAWADKGSRAVFVPPRLSPPNVTCTDGKPDVRPPGCVEATEVGNYLPLPYLLPAVALKVVHDSTTGLWLSRLASTLPCLGFILLAIVILWDGTAASLLGLLGAVSPMVLFVCSIVNPNGLELAACLAFAACIMRVARAPAQTSPGVWLALAVSGAAGILSWQLGPFFVLADLALGVALLGVRGLRELRLSLSRSRSSRFAVVALIGAALVYVIYGIASGLSHSRFGISPIRHSLHLGVLQLAPVLRDSVGTFGSLTVHLPSVAYWIWWLFVVTLITGAMWLGTRRDRWVLGVVVALGLAFPVLFYAWVYRFIGFGLQGRYVLPTLVLIPLLAGEIIHRRLASRDSFRVRRVIPFAAAVLAGLFQAYAWWFNARNSAGAPNTIRFYAHATWSPPLGWGPWIASASLGVGALLAFATIGILTTRPSSLNHMDRRGS
jgi:hypothetical protein